tara:strand:- start:541 stop:1527 length:987 start_codon:yes stop_codon:yes gene_type:complete
MEDSLVNNGFFNRKKINKKNNETTNKRFSFSMFVFLLIPLIFFFYFQFFTFYAPDTYVFVRYAVSDNLLRNISLFSITSNNFIFDLLTVVGDLLNLTSSLEFLLLIVISSALLFIAKYAFLLKIGKKRNVIIVLLASFYVLDLNQLRLNLSLFFLIILLYNNKAKFLMLTLSLLSHLMPLAVIFTRKIYFIPLIIFIVLPLSLFLEVSRVFAYLDNPDLKFFKSLLLCIPYIICYVGMKKSQEFNYKLMKFGGAFLLLGFFFVFYSTVMASRFFEIAFILCAIANVYKPFNKTKSAILFLFAISTFISRSIGGINAGSNNFILEYMLN